MGGANSCFKAPAAGEYAPQNSSNSRKRELVQKNLTKKDNNKNGNDRNIRLKDDIKFVEDEEVMVEKVTDNREFKGLALEEEDVCPTCFEEYTPENPKIGAKCCHVYHLSCIYEWKLRSEKCPICGKVLEVESLTFD